VQHGWVFNPQYQVDDPATANVLSRFPAMVQNRGLVAARVFECIREDWHVAEGAGVVHLARDSEDRRRAPLGQEPDGAEGVANHVAEEAGEGIFEFKVRKGRLNLTSFSSDARFM
jgi:hypothetical protein